MSSIRDVSDERGPDDGSTRDPTHPAIELVIKTDSEDGSAIYHPDEMHDPEVAEPWILIEPDGGLVHVTNRR